MFSELRRKHDKKTRKFIGGQKNVHKFAAWIMYINNY